MRLPAIMKAQAKAAMAADNAVRENETPGVTCRWRERGRRRTRQDQIPPTKKSPVKLRTSSGPHRTKKICFSSAGPACRKREGSSKFDPAV
jgi:hypothetical protein